MRPSFPPSGRSTPSGSWPSSSLPGQKAYDRRHDLGEAAGAWCDRVYLTEEDSGEEDTLDICQEIRPNVEKGKARCRIIANRGEAIRQAVLESERPTVLLLTGKGRETRQKRGTEYIDTPTDVEYVQAFLQEYDLRHRLTPAAPAQKALETLPALEQLKGPRPFGHPVCRKTDRTLPPMPPPSRPREAPQF